MNKTRIPELRQERGWTQERLASESGVGVRTVQRIESGNDASLDTVSLLADALQVSVRDLFSVDDGSDLDGRVESLAVRTEDQQASRDRILGAWRWLFIGIGLVVTVFSFTLGGAGLPVLIAYWGGGYLILMAIRRLILEPMLDRQYPLAKSRIRMRPKQTLDSGPVS